MMLTLLVVFAFVDNFTMLIIPKNIYINVVYNIIMISHNIFCLDIVKSYDNDANEKNNVANVDNW